MTASAWSREGTFSKRHLTSTEKKAAGHGGIGHGSLVLPLHPGAGEAGSQHNTRTCPDPRGRASAAATRHPCALTDILPSAIHWRPRGHNAGAPEQHPLVHISARGFDKLLGRMTRIHFLYLIQDLRQVVCFRGLHRRIGHV